LTLLGLGLLVFFLPHLLHELGLRTALLRLLPSEKVYKILYSLVAFAGIALIVVGKSSASFVMVWQPVYEYRWLSLLLMLPASILVAAGNIPNSYLRRIFRNPMLLGVACWGAAHLWSNGDRASVLLFGGFTAWAGFKFVSMYSRSAAAGKEPRLVWDLTAVALGCFLYLLLFIFHGQLFGIGLNIA